MNNIIAAHKPCTLKMENGTTMTGTFEQLLDAVKIFTTAYDETIVPELTGRVGKVYIVSADAVGGATVQYVIQEA